MPELPKGVSAWHSFLGGEMQRANDGDWILVDDLPAIRADERSKVREALSRIEKKDWPSITALFLGMLDGASPVFAGVGQKGDQIGYRSGAQSPPPEEQGIKPIELWLSLDPVAVFDLLLAALDQEPDRDR